MPRAEVQLPLFGQRGLPSARAPRRTMRVIDAGHDLAGLDIVRLQCLVCGLDTDWTDELPDDGRGRPCPRCGGERKAR